MPSGTPLAWPEVRLLESLVTVDRTAIVTRVEEVLKGFPQVAGAYLFGSALDKCRPDSDIDIAIVLEDNHLSEKAKEHLTSEIEGLLKPVERHHFDVVILEPEKLIFSYQVLREAVLIYDRNHERVTDVVEIITRRAADVYPRYRAALEDILAGVVE